MEILEEKGTKDQGRNHLLPESIKLLIRIVGTNQKSRGSNKSKRGTDPAPASSKEPLIWYQVTSPVTEE